MGKIVLSIVVAIIIIVGGYFLLKGSGPGDSALSTAPVAAQADAYATSTPSGSEGARTPATPGQVPSANTTQAINKIMQATLHTNKGDIVIEFTTAQTPKTVENFVKLSQAGFYDNTKFHRVIKDFMIQGGDPLSKDDSLRARWGTGGPGYQFNDEITTTNSNAAGTISMANSGPNTNGSQFFINTKDNTFLNPKHTVFGKVTAGMSVVTAIGNTATGAGDQPVEPVIITSITLK